MGVAERVDKRLQPVRGALHLDPHGIGLVSDPAGQSRRPGRIVDERPEAYPLDHTAYCNRQALVSRLPVS